MRFPVAVLALLLSASVQAQAWPQKQIRFIVPYPPGGSTDVAARAIAERIAPGLGQSVVVENRSGGGGNIGFEAGAKAPPDGHTVLIAPDQLASNAHVYKLTFDPLKDFIPVVHILRQPVVLAVHPSVGANTVAELIAIARQKTLAYATSGAGSQQHMAAEWFARLAGIKLTHVPYKGGAQAITDFLGGQVPVASLGSTPVIPHHKAGKVKILAQSTKARSPALPDVPTYEEAGLKGLVIDQWLGAFLPAGSPADAVSRLNTEINAALKDTNVIARFEKVAMEPTGSTAESFSRYYRESYAMYGKLVKELDIRVD
jgi:tripartite-type tricarboxylate transporter receptor subunit TctC